MAKADEVTIRFFFNKVQFTLRDRTKLKQFIKSIFKLEREKIGTLSYIFSTEEHLFALNEKYLKHNYKTDILTFPITKGDFIHAEIYISIKQVKENSKVYNISFKEELLRVIFHGALHLCGYKDKNKSQQNLMHQMEDYYLALYQSFT
jgi:probable rRNA maturation factor